MQVHIAKKCRIFAFLFRCVRIFAVIEYIFNLFVVCNRHRFGVDLAVGKIDIFRPFQFDSVLVSENCYLIKEDIMHRFSFESLNIDRLFGTYTGDITEVILDQSGKKAFLSSESVAETPAPLSA